MALDEPEKTRVVQWKKGDRLPSRRAEVVALLGGQTHVITVDLDSGRVVSDLVNPTSGYPILTMNDVFAASQVSDGFLDKRTGLIYYTNKLGLAFRFLLGPLFD